MKSWLDDVKTKVKKVPLKQHHLIKKVPVIFEALEILLHKAVPWIFITVAAVFHFFLFTKTFVFLDYVHGMERYLYVVEMAHRLHGGEENTLPLKYLQFVNASYPRRFSRKFAEAEEWQLGDTANVCRIKPYGKSNLKKCLQHQEFSDNTPVVFFSLRTAEQVSPAGYAFYVLGAFAAMSFDSHPLTVLYVAQITNIIILLLIGFWVIRITPILKWPLAILLSLPSMAAQRLFIMPDGILVTFSFLFVALLLLCYHQKRNISGIQKILFGTIGVIIGLIKAVYFLLPTAMLLLPMRLIAKSKQMALGFVLLLVFLTALISVLWGVHTLQKYYAINWEVIVEDNTVNAVDPVIWKRDFITTKKIQAVLTQPERFFTAIYNHLTTMTGLLNLSTNLVYWNEYIGFKARLSPRFISLILILSLVTCVISNPIYSAEWKRDKEFLPWPFINRMVCLGIALLTYTLLSFAMILLWRYMVIYNHSYVYMMQGRYLLPIMPLFFLCFFYKWPEKYESIRRNFSVINIAVSVVILNYIYYDYITIL